MSVEIAHASTARPAPAPSADGTSAGGPRTARSLRVLAADPDPAARAFYQTTLPGLGHEVCLAETGRQLLDLLAAAPPDVVIVADRFPDGSGFDLAEAVGRAAAVPVVVAGGAPEAWAAGAACVAGHLPKPLRADTLPAALAVAVGCFDRLRAARQEAADLRQALEDRKVVERAKGAVVRYCGLTEDEAYRRLRKAATSTSRKIVDVAREVMAAAEVFARLEADAPGELRDGSAAGRLPVGRRV